MMQQIILASQSPARLELLKKIGIENILVYPADIDEEPLKKEKPSELALRLSREKAAKVSLIYPNDIVIAADTVVALGTRFLPKALTDEDVRFCFNLYSGRRHKVYTGVTIRQGNIIKTRIAETIVRFKTLTKQEIEEYLASKEGINKAGGYSILGLAQVYMPFISGQVSTVVGLPLFETKNMLLSFGYKFDRSK